MSQESNKVSKLLIP